MRSRISRESRETVMKRSKGLCVYCGDMAEVIDHIVPVMVGGEDDVENLVASCSKCNQIAGKWDFRNLFDKKVFILSTYIMSKTYYRGILEKQSRAKRTLKKMLSGRSEMVTADTAYAMMKAMLLQSKL